MSDEDRFYFLTCLRQAYEKFGIRFHVYCLMDNHYHSFLEALNGGLARAMHLINMRYANYFNLKHGSCGHTFQSRYKAILVEAAVYARELASYIHLNPVRAGIVERPEDYEWSNYRSYVGKAPAFPWAPVSFTLQLFGEYPAEARRQYAAYVLSHTDRSLPHPLKPAARTGILGGPEFIDQIRARVNEDGKPAAVALSGAGPKTSPRPSMERIVQEMEILLGIKSQILRKMTIYFVHTRTDYSLREIGEFFKIGNSGITDICRRMTQDLGHNQTLARIIAEIETRLRE